MPQFAMAGFLVVHGLITTFIGIGGATSPDSPSMALPSWLSWWPGPFGRSWLVDALHLGSGASVAGGLLWLAAGVALVGAGLGWLGVPVLGDSWRILAIVGGSLGLVALGLYFHPLYLVAILIDVAVVVLVTGAVTPVR